MFCLYPEGFHWSLRYPHGSRSLRFRRCSVFLCYDRLGMFGLIRKSVSHLHIISPVVVVIVFGCLSKRLPSFVSDSPLARCSDMFFSCYHMFLRITYLVESDLVTVTVCDCRWRPLCSFVRRGLLFLSGESPRHFSPHESLWWHDGQHVCQ